MCFNNKSTDHPAPYSVDNSQTAVTKTVTPVTEADKIAAQSAMSTPAAAQAVQKDQTSASGLNVR